MKTLRNLAISAIALISMGALASGAAAKVYAFDYNITGDELLASGTLDATDLGNGNYQIDSIKGTATVGGTAETITGLSTYGSADQMFNYTPGPAPYNGTPDYNGISFTTKGVTDPSVTDIVNFFNPGGSPLLDIQYSEDPGGYATDTHNVISDTFTNVGAVPEPGVWVMMLAGIGLMGAAIRMNRRNNPTGQLAA